MKKPVIIGASIFAVVAIAAIAVAQNGNLGPADTNGDGVLTKAEALAKADARFKLLDANSDGQLDNADRAARQKARFAEMDSDKNGSISETEFNAGRAARGTDERDEFKGQGRGRRGGHGRHGRNAGHFDMFARADTNNDQIVTKAEHVAAAETRFANADTDKNGKLTASELAAARVKSRQSWWSAQSTAAKPADAAATAKPAAASAVSK